MHNCIAIRQEYDTLEIVIIVHDKVLYVADLDDGVAEIKHEWYNVKMHIGAGCTPNKADIIMSIPLPSDIDIYRPIGDYFPLSDLLDSIVLNHPEYLI